MLFLSDFTSRATGTCVWNVYTPCVERFELAYSLNQPKQAQWRPSPGMNSGRADAVGHTSRVTDYYLYHPWTCITFGSKWRSHKCRVQPFLFSSKRKHLLTFRRKLHLRFDSVSQRMDNEKPSVCLYLLFWQKTHKYWYYLIRSVLLNPIQCCKWWHQHEPYWVCKSFCGC